MIFELQKQIVQRKKTDMVEKDITKENVDSKTETSENLPKNTGLEMIKNHPGISYAVFSFVLGSLCMFLLLYLSKRIFNDENVLLFGDGFKTASNIRMCARNILNGESIFYSFSVSMGMNTSLLVAYDFMSPFNILYILFYNADVNLVTAMVYILKTGMTAMCFQIFASKTLKCKNFNSLIFALFYSMCGFAVFHGLSNNMWADALYVLPLVCIGVFNLVKKNKYIFLICIYAYAFIVNFYTGYMVGVFTFILFFVLVFIQKELSTKEKALRIAKYFAACVIAVMIAAFIWMPTLYCIINYSGNDSSSYKNISMSVADLINFMFWGRQDYDVTTKNPFVYSGIPALMLVPFFFIINKIKAENKIIFGALLISCVSCFFIKPLYILVHAFDMPAGFDYRFSFVFSFIICCMALFVSEQIEQINKILMLSYCVILSVFLVLSQIVFKLYDADLKSDVLFPLGSIVLLAVWFAAGLFFVKNKTSLAYIVALLLTVSEVVSNSVHQWHGFDYFSVDSYNAWSFYMNEILDDIKHSSDNNGFERYCFQIDMVDTSDSFWGFNGIEDFGSNDNPHLRVTLQNLGLYTSVHMLHASGLNPATEMIMGVKAIYFGDDVKETAGSASSLIKVPNDYYASVGFMVYDEAEKVVIDKNNSFENINTLIGAMTGVDDVFVKTERERIGFSDLGINLMETENGYALIRSDTDFPKLSLIVDRNPEFENNTGYREYVQVNFDNIGFYDDIKYSVFGMVNQMNTEDYYLTYSPVIELTRTQDKYGLVIASYMDDPDIVIKSLDFYGFDPDAMKEAYENISSEVFTVDEFKNGYIKGRINVTGDRRLLFLSVPYIMGWKLYVNGEEQQIVPVVNGDFVGIRLPDKGNYDIELKYTCPLLKEGFFVSGAGLLFTLFATLLGLYARKKQKVGTSE